jgi:hypothetical protein
VTVVKTIRFDIFEKQASRSTLRLTAGGRGRERTLDAGVVDDLLGRVAGVYYPHSVPSLVFGSRELVNLGRDLHGLLDGDEHWLTDADTTRGAVLLIDEGEEKLRHLPWELLAAGDTMLTVDPTAPLVPARLARKTAAIGTPAPANRPLRVLFMATSPEGAEPELSYELEEAQILAAAQAGGIELVVEESGSLEGLGFIVAEYGADYFDVFHLSGHAAVVDDRPVFVIEDDVGNPAVASPEEIAEALGGCWPRLVFASGCHTGRSPADGALPSMSASLVAAGAPAVLGWALPVGDGAASLFAAHLYGSLATGTPLAAAVAHARREVYKAKSPFWHYLRLYTDLTPLDGLVTPKATKGRPVLKSRPAAESFLDPETKTSRVASRSGFIGRRRQIQTCLRTLRTPTHDNQGVEGVVLYGMGGLGKSTLASRLLERMPHHQRVVWFGAVDDIELQKLVSKVNLGDLDAVAAAERMLAHESVDLDTKIRYLLGDGGPLADIPCVFVFDNFEDGNLEPDGDHYTWAPRQDPDRASALEVVGALLRAIRATGSPSRVIITSRYQFPEPPGTRLRFEPLRSLATNELTKKLAALPNLRPTATTTAAIRERAVNVAAGNPRLLEWLDKVVDAPDLDTDAVLDAIEAKAAEFRETILAEQLLTRIPDPTALLLARVNVVELPIPVETIQAIHNNADVDTHLARATQLGLIELSPDPETGTNHYLVSNVLRPLLRPLLTNDQHTTTCAAAARSLDLIWAGGPPNPTNHQ